MVWLILGVALWAGAHEFKRIAPDARARMGERGKGLVAILVALSIVLMVVGYRAAPVVPVWQPPYFLTHVNNLLVLIAFYLFAVSGAKTRLHQRLRHPQLTGFGLWAFAHLLVNGDLASIILFGGLLAWAVAAVVVINRAEPAWTPPPVGPVRKEFTAAAAALVLYGVVAAIHAWLGVWPFG